MAQFKIYGIKARLVSIRELLSETIHESSVKVLGLPADKKFHRFFCMEKENMLYPDDRTDAYTIIEISIIEGRSVETKKRLVRLLFDNIRDKVGIEHQDIEICIQESPASNWGFRGVHGDEAKLSYKINV